jgi:hypothetical protein
VQCGANIEKERKEATWWRLFLLQQQPELAGGVAECGTDLPKG